MQNNNKKYKLTILFLAIYVNYYSYNRFRYKRPLCAIIKGEIYNVKDINIVDISNDISKFDIRRLFVFKNSYRNFPDGTVHIIGVNDELSNENQHLAVQIDNQFIIGPDNGIFSLIFEEIFPDKIVELNIPIESDILTFTSKMFL